MGQVEVHGKRDEGGKRWRGNADERPAIRGEGTGKSDGGWCCVTPLLERDTAGARKEEDEKGKSRPYVKAHEESAMQTNAARDVKGRK